MWAGAVLLWAGQVSAQAPKAAVPAPAPAAAATDKPACTNPDALGVSRIVEIDTTGGPGFGFEHFKQLDFLRDKAPVQTIASYDEALLKDAKLPTVSTRPVSSVVTTVSK